MSLVIHKEPDMVFETGILLFSGLHREYVERITQEELGRYGLAGVMVPPKSNKMYKKYVDIFQKNRITLPQEAFFLEDCDQKLFTTFVVPFFLDKQLLKNIKQSSEAQLRQCFMNGYNAIFETEMDTERLQEPQDYISFIHASEFESPAKWKLTLFLGNIVEYMRLLGEMIEKNLPATRIAFDAVRQPFEKMIESENLTPEVFCDRYILKNMDTLTEVYPTLAAPFSQILMEEYSYYGLFWGDLIDTIQRVEDTPKLLASRLKALSDKSKLEILLLLRDRPWYNLEMANELKLTAATVCYHMDSLLTCGMVTMEKRQKRIYYRLDQKKIDWIRDELNNMFYPRT